MPRLLESTRLAYEWIEQAKTGDRSDNVVGRRLGYDRATSPLTRHLAIPPSCCLLGLPKPEFLTEGIDLVRISRILGDAILDQVHGSSRCA